MTVYLSNDLKVPRMHNMMVQAAMQSWLAYLEKQLVETTKVKVVEVNSELHSDLGQENQQRILDRR